MHSDEGLTGNRAASDLASGFDPTTESAAVLMTRWMFPYIGFMSMVALASGVLNTWKRFAVPAATPCSCDWAKTSVRARRNEAIVSHTTKRLNFMAAPSSAPQARPRHPG